MPTREEINKVFGSRRIVNRIQLAVKKVATRLGIPVHVLQAIVWVQHRKNIGMVKTNFFEE